MNFSQLLNQVLGTVQNSTGSAASVNPDMLKKLGGGAAAAGLLSVLLGKKGGGKMVRAGSMAALGALAYHAYQNWQRQNPAPGAAAAPAAFEPQGQDAEAASRVILRTMIAAAAADGLIDDQERQLIHGETGDDPQLQQWLAAQMQQPATPAAIAADIGDNSPLAAEAYLAARMVCGELVRKEIVFLAQLAEALRLDEQLVAALEQQAGF